MFYEMMMRAVLY